MWWPAVVNSEWELSQFPLRLDYGQSPHAYINQRLQIQSELLIMSGMPLETCWAFNERLNNKFYYKVASCWLFLQSHTIHVVWHICSSSSKYIMTHYLQNSRKNYKFVTSGNSLIKYGLKWSIQTGCLVQLTIGEVVCPVLLSWFDDSVHVRAWYVL